MRELELELVLELGTERLQWLIVLLSIQCFCCSTVFCVLCMCGLKYCVLAEGSCKHEQVNARFRCNSDSSCMLSVLNSCPCAK